MVGIQYSILEMAACEFSFGSSSGRMSLLGHSRRDWLRGVIGPRPLRPLSGSEIRVLASATARADIGLGAVRERF